MSYLNRSPYLLLLLACLLVFTAGCDSLTGGAADVLSLVDDDTGRNTTMVQAPVRFPSLYRRDNATREALTVRGQRGFTAVLHDNWIY